VQGAGHVEERWTHTLHATAFLKQQRPALARSRRHASLPSEDGLLSEDGLFQWAAKRAPNRGCPVVWRTYAHVASLEDAMREHPTPPEVRDAVLTKFTAGTMLESAKGGPLILGYDYDDIPT